MPISSVSDFERFARKCRKNIDEKVQKRETDAAAYVLDKEKATLNTIEAWRALSTAEWQQALQARRQQGERRIADAVDRQWSAFKKERKKELKAALRRRLQEAFPALAACFVNWVEGRYESGVFTMPKAYRSLVKGDGFEVQECNEEQLIFANGNLYIEYSVERILDELGEEITQQMHFEENEWQA